MPVPVQDVLEPKHDDIGAQNIRARGADHTIFSVPDQHGAPSSPYDGIFEEGFKRGATLITDWDRYFRVTTEKFEREVKESPPAGLLIDMLVPAERAEDMLLALGNAFQKRWLPKYGPRGARLIFLLQSTGTVVGYWINWVRKYLNVFKLFAS
jgi:hypothetical protein